MGQSDLAASFDFYETNDPWAPGGSDEHYFIRYGTNLAATVEVPVEIWEAFRSALAQQAQPLTDEMIDKEATFHATDNAYGYENWRNGAAWARDRMAQQAQPTEKHGHSSDCPPAPARCICPGPQQAQPEPFGCSCTYNVRERFGHLMDCSKGLGGLPGNATERPWPRERIS